MSLSSLPLLLKIGVSDLTLPVQRGMLCDSCFLSKAMHQHFYDWPQMGSMIEIHLV